MRNHSSSVKIAKKNAPYGAPQRAVCGFEAVFRLTHTVNQAVIHHDQYSTAGEHGLRKITHTDTVKILNCFSLTLPELFPSLISYDGGISYLPLRVIDTVEVAGENYNFFADDAPYVTPKDEPVNTWASFPVVRYGPEGEPGMNYTPSELTMDEYFNTCELFFEDAEEEKPNLDGKKLPPTYIHM